MVRIELSNPGTDVWTVTVDRESGTYTATVPAGAVLPVLGDGVTVASVHHPDLTQATLAVRDVGIAALPQPVTSIEAGGFVFILAGILCGLHFFHNAHPFRHGAG